MKCPRCGNASQDRGATTCRVCGRELPSDRGRATARSSTHYQDPRTWERHVLKRVEGPPFVLTPGRELIIGRSRDSDLLLQSPRVSRNHTQVFWQQDRPVLRDLGSENGTVVNGARIVEHLLRDADEVTIGPFLLTYRHLKVVGSVTDPRALEEMIDSQADTQPMQSVAMSGRLQDVSLYEVLETLSYNQRTGTVEVFSGWGGEGKIGLQDGQAVYAYAPGQEGPAALLALLGWTDGSFSFATELQQRRPNVRPALAEILARFRTSEPSAGDYLDADQSAS